MLLAKIEEQRKGRDALEKDAYAQSKEVQAKSGAADRDAQQN